MYIKSLAMVGFRSAFENHLQLDDRLNVFVGMNGTGKSTVLDAIAILLSWLVNRMKSAGASGRQITDSDIQNGKSWSSIELTCTMALGSIMWRLVKTRSGRTAPDERTTLSDLRALAKHYQTLISEAEGKANLPLFVYYPVNRAVLDIPLRIRTSHVFDPFSAYDGSLTTGADFRAFFEWFRQREDMENEARRDQETLFQGERLPFPDPQLEAVRAALSQFMPDFRGLTVRRSPLRMETEKNGHRFTVNQLSGGEKCLMAMIGDLARRMAIANPIGERPLEGEGIILIDEIDLHLHPIWQRMVVPKLLEVFPNCQFMVSTHSPHVITHVQPDNLFLLGIGSGGMTIDKPSESYGKTADRIFEDLMGLETTRPDQVADMLQNIYRLIDQGDVDEAKVRIADFKNRIGEDSELVKASVLIKRMETIGK